MAIATKPMRVEAPVPRPDRITVAAFAGMVLFAGINPVAVRLTKDELAPFWGAGIRFAAASLMLFALARWKKAPFPRGKMLVSPILFGVLGVFCLYAFIYVGLRHIDASLAAPLMASMPLITLFLAAAQGLEPFRWRGLWGGLASAAGIVVLSGVGRGGGAPIKYVLFILAASVCAAQASIFTKKLPKVHPFMMNAIAMAVAAVLFLSASLLTSEKLTLPVTGKVWWWLGFLIVFGSTGLFVFYVTVLDRWTVTGASYQFVMFPIVAVFAAAWLGNEVITASRMSGVVLVVLGVYIGALSHGSRRRSSTEPEPAPVVVDCQPC